MCIPQTIIIVKYSRRVSFASKTLLNWQQFLTLEFFSSKKEADSPKTVFVGG